MKHGYFLFFLLFCRIGLSTPLTAQNNWWNDSLWVLDDIPKWIEQNVKFPKDAYKSRIAGIEQFVISAAWDGRVFITSGLNTLNPAFDEEIKNVVRRAPRCRFAGNSLKDIYKLVKIDFSTYISDSLRSDIRCISRHLPPCFTRHGEEMHRLKSKEEFVKWLSSRFRLPRNINLINYIDTVSLCYTVTEEGKLKDVCVEECDNKFVKSELERIVRRSPRWKPAITEDKVLIPVSIKDKIVIGINENGEKKAFEIYTDEVCRNSTSIPLDSNMIVLNPEIQLQYDGEHTSFMKVMHDSLVVDRRVKFIGSFVVEKDSTVSNINIETTDTRADSVIIALIKHSKWIPARQGGEAVRSIYVFTGVKLPLARYLYAIPSTPSQFMNQGRLAPFYHDPSYNTSQKERWNYFRQAYPEVDAVIHGYSKFKYLNGNDYKEALMMRGFPIFNLQKRVLRKREASTKVP